MASLRSSALPLVIMATVLGTALVASACSTTVDVRPGASDDGGAADGETGTPACATGATRCAGTKIETCAGEGASATWQPAAECPGDQSCRDDACSDPTEQQLAQASSVAKLADELHAGSAWHEAVDVDAVKAKERAAILKGDGADLTYFASAWRTLNAFPQGHQSLFSTAASVCGKGMPLQQTSRFGVCGRPSAGGLVVTYAKASNKLGLKVGDVIRSAGDASGDALYEASYLRPVCGGVFPAASGRKYAGAASFFGTVPAGTKLGVRDLAGGDREVTVPAESDAKATDCTDPFARNREIYAEATVRPDGIAVIRLPSFYPFDKSAPTDPSGFEAFAAAYQAEIVKVFDTVKTAKAIVWDARGNTGGITSVGLAIVSGFTGVKTGPISYCRTREAGSSPPSFETARYAEYELTSGGPFAYAGRVVVVADGLGYSAGDYFPFATMKGGAKVVGSASAGAFGGGRAPIELDGPPKLSANYDPTACFDAQTNLPLEGNAPAPTVAVDYDPAALAAGKDPVLERAIQELGAF